MLRSRIHLDCRPTVSGDNVKGKERDGVKFVSEVVGEGKSVLQAFGLV